MKTKKQKVNYISRTITFTKKPHYKLIDNLIDKFIKETKCKFIDWYIIDLNKIILSGIIK